MRRRPPFLRFFLRTWGRENWVHFVPRFADAPTELRLADRFFLFSPAVTVCSPQLVGRYDVPSNSELHRKTRIINGFT